MNRMKTLIQAAILICLPYMITGSCMFDRAYRHNGATFCVTDFDPDNIHFLRAGQYRLLEDKCMNCTCDDSGLTCCGYGFAAGRMRVPPQCTIKRIGSCGYDIVKTDNEEESCNSGDQQIQVANK